MTSPLPSHRAPELSYILPTDELATVRGVLAALARQGRADAVELVLVSPIDLSAAAAEIPPELATVRFERCAAPLELAAARAVGVRAASTSLVFLGETHSYPEPEMVAALLAAFDGGWDCVVPALVNANPGSGPSRAGFLIDYGAWHPGRAPGPVEQPLVYNCAYRREALLALGERLESALTSIDDDLWSGFAADGRRACFEPAARIRHLNVGRPGTLVLERLTCGIRFGDFRARRWRWPRRLLYAAASPLVPFVLAARTRAAVGVDAVARRRWVSTTFWIAVAVVARAVGEALGYLGVGRRSATTATEIEIHKVRYAVRSAP